MSGDDIKLIIEAALFAAAEPLNVTRLQQLFSPENQPTANDIKKATHDLMQDYENRAIRLVEVASGFRFQVREEYAPSLQRLWEKKPPRYTPAFLETLALIAYRQPVTRGEIEEIRGVAVSQHIIKTLQDREWIKIVGYRDVPGKPALLGTTQEFLNYFGLKTLEDLPPLPDVANLGELENQFKQQLALEMNVVAVEEEPAAENVLIEENAELVEDNIEQ